jgi:cell division protein FtsB
MKITKGPHTMVRFLPTLVFLAVLVGVFYLGIQVNLAHSEYMHWKSRESVLVKELEDLRREAAQHQAFLDRLRRNPDFQDEVARKELGYGDDDEWLYRFPSNEALKP